MVRIQYIGLPSKLSGKHLMKVLANLKDFGVGRMFTRGRMCECYDAPTFYIVKKVQPAMDKDTIWGDVYAHEYFRCYDRGVRIIESHLPDFRLVPKEDEQKYIDQIVKNPPAMVLPREREFPPLLKILVKRDLEARGQKFDDNIKLPFVITPNPLLRIAEPGEKPSVNPDPNACPLIYEKLKRGINYDT